MSMNGAPGATGLRDRAAIVGIGTTNFGAVYRDLDRERSAYDLGLEALKNALDDAGLKKTDLDGFIVVRIPGYAHFADMLGLPQLRLVNVLEGGGRMAGIALQYAAMAVATGQAETVAVVYGNNGRSVGARYGGEGSQPPGPDDTAGYENMVGFTSPGASAALMWHRYQHEYNAPNDALAALAINNRKNGALNPNAVFQKPITYEEYINARFIAEPLRLYDYCIINDGGVAFIITRPEKARTLKHPPAYIGATYAASNLRHNYHVQDFWWDACQDISRRLYREADVTPTDVKVAEIYDNFTPTTIFALEGFGFCERGKGHEWIRDGRIELGGELPVNTSGGHTAESYMQGHALICEAVRQVRGEAGARQVPNADVATYICAAPITTATILHR
jgi:acetyl-CoA acetyltransferase